MLALAIGKSGVIENEQASRSLFADLESGNGIDAGIPVTDAPCLDDSTVRYRPTCRPTIIPPKQENPPPTSLHILAGAPPLSALNCFSSMRASYRRVGLAANSTS